MDRQLDIQQVSYLMPVTILGTGEDGRTLVRCPECGDDATVLEDGRIYCPYGETIQNAVRNALTSADG
jgi:hypothetical protein